MAVIQAGRGIQPGNERSDKNVSIMAMKLKEDDVGWSGGVSVECN